MPARRMRTVFAAPFVVTAACSSPKLERVIAVTWHGDDGCVVREGCPAGVSCKSRPPYETECSEEAAKHRYAKLSDGSCRVLPEGCSKDNCLGADVPCPPAVKQLRTIHWVVERNADGTGCTIVAEPRTDLSAKIAPLQVACEKFDDIYSITRHEDGKCIGVDDFPCEEGASCNPPATHVQLSCPTK